MDISKIKLIIWDLDETFWIGTISEQKVVPAPQAYDLVLMSSKKGIINSICSKNDEEPCINKLRELGIADYFVFNSINWQPKGQRIKQMLKDMNLRPANTLFIDDNRSNLEEAKYYCPEIMTMLPDQIGELYDAVSTLTVSDKELERLNRYKLLEHKHSEKQKVSSNEEFLYQSGIHVNIHTNCLNELDRIYELIMRSNQLNYTKLRSSRDELLTLLNDPQITAGYVTASDKYGDYGIVGFFACKDGALIHFLFSCRTLGMGIEQYVYEQIGFPELVTVGEVSASVGKDEPPVNWINRDTAQNKNDFSDIENTDFKVLIKGPCDLNQIFSFIKNEDMFDCEFTYVSRESQSEGVTIEGMNHTSQIVESYSITDAQKRALCTLPICDSAMFPDSIYTNKYGIIFISILTDANLGLYRKKDGGQIFAFGEYLYPLTDKSMWDKYLNKKVYTANYTFKKDDLQKIADEYEFLGRLTPEETAKNLRFIYDHIQPDTLLVIMLGCEREYTRNTLPAWNDRHNYHKKINAAVRAEMGDLKNVILFDVNDYITSDDDFNDSINHYKKRIYYLMAQRFTEIINSRACRTAAKNTSRIKLAYLTLKQRIKKLLYPNG